MDLDEKEIRISILFFVIAIILINSLVYVNVYETNIILLLLNLMMIIANIIAIFLFKSNKIIAYTTGLVSFIFSLIFQYLITEKSLMRSNRLAFILAIIFIYYIYDEIKNNFSKSAKT